MSNRPCPKVLGIDEHLRFSRFPTLSLVWNPRMISADIFLHFWSTTRATLMRSSTSSGRKYLSGSTGSGAFSMPRVGGVWERGRARTRLAYLKMPARVEMNRLTVLPANGSPVGVAGRPFRQGLSLPLATGAYRPRSTSSSPNSVMGR